MRYICDLCNYSTDKTSSYKKHLASLKHKKKVTQDTNVEMGLSEGYPKVIRRSAKNAHVCKYCNQAFTAKSNLSRHYNYCKAKNDTETDLKKTLSETKEKLREKEKQNNELKHMILYFEEILATTTKTLDKSVTAISFANIYFPDGLKLDPPKENELKTLYHNSKYPKKERSYRRKTVEQQKKIDDRKLYNNVSYEYAGGTRQLAEYITHVITEIYKKDNPNDQSIWNSDSARLNFIIRDVIENTDKTKWHIDKKGVKVTRIIIDPIVNELKQVLEKEIIYSSSLMAENGGLIRQDESRKLNRVAKIIEEIDEGILQDAILKKMAGHFYLDKDLANDKLGKQIECDTKEELLEDSVEDLPVGSPKRNPLINKKNSIKRKNTKRKDSKNIQKIKKKYPKKK